MHWRAVLIATLVACGGARPAPAPGPAPEPAEVAAAPAPMAPSESITAERMLRDVAWLCDPERAGRGSYQPGGRDTAAWIAAAFEDIGLEVTRQPVTGGAENVIGILRGGADAVLVSAHYDHLGIDDDGVVYPGADDNASGVAALLAVARAVSDLEPGQTVVFVAFGAEEDGLVGSNTYVHDPAWPLERTRVLINFDMVGRNLFEMVGSGTPDTVGVVGLETSALHRDVTERAAEAEGMSLLAGTAKLLARFGFDGRTDDWWFRQKGVKTIHFSTGLHRDYHEPTDTPDKLRPEQMARIARIATRVVVELAGLSPPSP